MNPSTALATVLVDELVRLGVTHAVLAPGSRSAPLAYALHEADRAGRLRLHVRVDERSAAFLAVGLAKVTRCPAVVVTTSGTAVANLHPAVLEADAAGVPLVLLTADRPPQLQGTRANQTTDQVKVFGAAPRWFYQLGVPHDAPGQQATWRSVADRAFAAAVGALDGNPGPVHVNVPLPEPLTPDLRLGSWPESLDGRPDGEPWTDPGRVAAPAAPGGGVGDAGTGGIGPMDRTLMVLGDLPDPAEAAQAVSFASASGWPVLAEPFGPRTDLAVLPHAPLLAEVATAHRQLLPQRIVVAGRPTLSRSMAALLRRPEVAVEVVTAQPHWPDPAQVARRVHPWPVVLGRPLPAGPEQSGWAQRWHQLGRVVQEALAGQLSSLWPSGPAVAAAVLEALPTGTQLMLGSSTVVRDVDLVRRQDAAQLVANRGLAGIDGTVSTAVGLALAQPHRRHVCLLGDLTFVHDINGLAIGPAETRPEVTFVVVNDDGGGIFTLLEYGQPEFSGAFDRVFATPVGADLASLCRGYRASHLLVETAEQVRAALTETVEGIRVIEIVLPRSGHRSVRQRLSEVAQSAVAQSVALLR